MAEIIVKDEYVQALAENEAISEGVTLPDTVAPLGRTSYGESEVEFGERYGITPLYTSNHQYAYPEEYLCDPNTGEPAIMRADGTMVSVSEIGRLDSHIEMFSDIISYVGMRKAKIVSLIPDDDSKVMTYEASKSDTNILDGDTLLSVDPRSLITMIVSLDISVLSPVEGSVMLRCVDLDPIVHLEYLVGSSTTPQVTELRKSVLRRHVFTINDDSVTFTNISLPEVNKNGYTSFIHSILIAYTLSEEVITK